jgi:DNA ligase (NAD+)
MQRPPEKKLSEMSVEELALSVRYHNWRYFSLADPELSDASFDAVTRRLQELSPGHPALRELRGDATSTGLKVTHAHPMLSLDKCYTEEEFRNWLHPKRGKDRTRAFLGDFIETPKVDGVAASFHYDARGRLVMAATRGDGVTGESFLPNAQFIEEVPKKLAGPPVGVPVEVRGELYLKLSVFERLSGDFSNPRNTTAGAIKQKDARKTAGYGLSFFAYDVLGLEFTTEMEKVDWLRAHGLIAVETVLLNTADQVQTSFEAWVERRKELDFETDGVVYKANSVEQQGRMGATAHHPRYAIAYKFRGDSGVTTLNDVIWSVSRSGAITPVAIIEGIALSGAVVTRCSLHNLAIMQKLNLTLGAQVTATRRGGVIPHIENVVSPGTRPIVIPERCPSCDSPAIVVDDFLRCASPESCVTAVLGTLEHFVKGVGIDGFGPKIIEQCHAAGLLEHPGDFFRLSSVDLILLDRMGDKLATRLLASIESARTLPLPHFLRALGIQDLGAVASKTVASTFQTMDSVLRATGEEIAAIHGLGEKTGAGIAEGLEAKKEIIEDLLQWIDVEAFVEDPKAEVSNHPLSGKTVLFTGKLLLMGRKEVQSRVQKVGGLTPSGVSASLDYLVIGDDGSPLLGEGRISSKHKKADAFNAGGSTIEIMTEGAFRTLLETAASTALVDPDEHPDVREDAAAEPVSEPTQGSLF